MRAKPRLSLHTCKWRIGIVDSADGLWHGGSCVAAGCCPCASHFVQAISRKPAPCSGGRACRLCTTPSHMAVLRRDNEKLLPHERTCTTVVAQLPFSVDL
jgi:hypothetical protein